MYLQQAYAAWRFLLNGEVGAALAGADAAAAAPDAASPDASSSSSSGGGVALEVTYRYHASKADLAAALASGAVGAGAVVFLEARENVLPPSAERSHSL